MAICHFALLLSFAHDLFRPGFSDLASPAEASNETTNPRQGYAQAENRHPVFRTMLYCFGAAVAPADPGPRGSFRLAMHFLRKALRAAPCSLWSSAPNLQVAIFCFASTAKHGPAGTNTIRAAAKSA
jgi:hypothetical protein